MSEKNPEVIPANIQQQALTLLICDKKHAVIVRNSLPQNAWVGDTAISFLVAAIYVYIDKYNEPPGDHTHDVIAGLNVSDDVKPVLHETVSMCLEYYKDMNLEYALDLIRRFHRESTLLTAVHDSVSLIKQARFDEVEDLLRGALKVELESFDPGGRMLDALDEIMYGEKESPRDRLKLGIPALDNKRLVPERGTMWLLIGLAKRGKSWGLIHVGAQALMQNYKVLHITLELGKKQTLQRYIQNLFRVTHKAPLDEPPSRRLAIRKEEDDFEWRMQNPDDLLSFAHDTDLKKLRDKLTKNRWLNNNLYVKKFPMKNMTFAGYRAFLDALELRCNFIPDVVILDYPDLMKLPGKQARWQELADVFQQIRGEAEIRNHMLCVVTQSGKSGAEETTVDDHNVAGSWDKIATADTVITYNQNDMEHQMGLARLFVSNSRNDESRFQILITQNYSTGQFCLSSRVMNSNLKGRLKSLMKSMDEQKEAVPA